MFNYSQKSKDLLIQCHPDLQVIFNEAIKYIDISILSTTIRTLEEQKQFVAEGKSKTMNSMHLKKLSKRYNKYYSYAVDWAPYPIDFNDTERFVYFGGMIKLIAIQLYDLGKINNKIKVGFDWNDDGSMKNESFRDYVHIELTGD